MQSASFKSFRGKVKIDFQHKSFRRHQAAELEPKQAKLLEHVRKIPFINYYVGI